MNLFALAEELPTQEDPVLRELLKLSTKIKRKNMCLTRILEQTRNDSEQEELSQLFEVISKAEDILDDLI